MITSLFVGDVWLSPSLLIEKDVLALSLNGFSQKKYDIFICNLEAPIASDERRFNRRAILKTENSILESLKLANINVLSLANNHINDFGSEGLLKTIYECKRGGFNIVGAGKNLDEAREPLVLEIKKRKIAIMSYADTVAYVGSIAATERSAGIAPLEIKFILEDIEKIRKSVDDIWILLHWGVEFIRYPTPYQMRIAEVLVRSGATMILGHHPHVLLGKQKIDETPVYYSLGNFIFPDILLEDESILKWDNISRSSLALENKFHSGQWSTQDIFLKLNRSGLPVIVESVKEPSRKFEKISKRLGNKYYQKLYKYYYLSEKIRLTIWRFIHIGKLIKDVKWHFRVKGLNSGIK